MIEKIGNIIKEKDSFLIVSHKNPDGDAIGSSLALYSALKDMGKNVQVVNLTKPPEVYSFLEDYDIIEPIKTMKKTDVIIAVDTAEIERCGIKKEDTKDKIFINIDHHKTNTLFGDINFIDGDASAVGIMLWRIFKQNGIAISKKTAQYLYVSIMTDTGSFRYSSTTPETMRIAADLLEIGVDPWFCAYNIYESNTLETIKLLGLVLNTLQVFIDGKIAILYVTEDMFKKTATQIEHSEGFVNYARSIRGAEVGILLREDRHNVFKISMRSKGKIDVARAASVFGGGGHKNAAGAQIEGTLEEVKTKIIDSFSFLK